MFNIVLYKRVALTIATLDRVLLLKTKFVSVEWLTIRLFKELIVTVIILQLWKQNIFLGKIISIINDYRDYLFVLTLTNTYRHRDFLI